MSSSKTENILQLGNASGNANKIMAHTTDYQAVADTSNNIIIFNFILVYHVLQVPGLVSLYSTINYR